MAAGAEELELESLDPADDVEPAESEDEPPDAPEFAVDVELELEPPRLSVL